LTKSSTQNYGGAIKDINKEIEKHSNLFSTVGTGKHYQPEYAIFVFTFVFTTYREQYGTVPFRANQKPYIVPVPLST
jgi:hypothetical protein